MSDPNANAYTTLGISKTSTDKEIKQAYVNLVKKYDPEKHTERFMVIQRAFDRLKTPKTRAKEDVLSFNVFNGEYLFQTDEKYTGEGPPEDEELATLRAAQKSGAHTSTTRTDLIRSLFQRAHYSLRRKQLNLAIENWAEVLELDPSHIRARRNMELACANLGYSYALHGLHEEAMELWERALKMNPDNTELVHNLALVSEKAAQPLRATRYWGEVLARWKVALNKDPENEYLRQSIIETLNHHGEYVEAHDKEIAAAEARENAKAGRAPAAPPAPAAPSRHAVPPQARAAAGHPPAQAPASSSAIPKPGVVPSAAPRASAPSSPAVPLPTESARGGAASIERFRELLKLKPDDFDTHYQLCNKLMGESLYDEAQKELMNLARKHPRNVEVLNMLGWALLNSGQKDLAFNAWKKSLTLDPSNSDTREQLVRAHLTMGKAFRSKGLFTQALVHFKQLMQLMPGSAEVHLEIAATYDMKGDVRSASQEYNRVLTIDPKNKVARKAINDLRMKR